MKTEENWPKQPTELIHDKNLSTKELSKNNKNFLNVHRFNLIIDFENLLTKRISSWRRLVRVVVWLKRFMFPQQYEQLNTTRVIHLEVTETQSTNDFLLAWRRFINKRGVHPSHAYSD